jgi:hypothetical protein
MDEIFESAMRSAGDLAGVFEFDGEVSYFYLYRVSALSGNEILDAMKISVADSAIELGDVRVRWSADEKLVFLVVKDQPCAVFDCEHNEKYGGDCTAAAAHFPATIVARLSSH